MILPQLALRNFRSHRDRMIELGPVTVAVGPNGAGKTNLLEALWVLATTRSFRTNRETELIHWDAAGTEVAGGAAMVRIVRQPIYQKGVFQRGVAVRTIDYLGELPAVLFTPDSLTIVTGSPADRRRFLDTVIAQQSTELARTLLRYRQVVLQRNALLRLLGQQRAALGDLAPWDEQLVGLGEKIVLARQRLVDQLIPAAAARYGQLAGQPAGPLLMLRYLPAGGRTVDELRLALARERERELRLQTTLVGPHRDEVAIDLAGRRLADYGSRGEIRSVLLALKWAECEVIAQGGRPPILLLDDLFSELDQAHRAAVGELLATTQTFCTTTDLNHLPANLGSDLAVVNLAEGASG